METVNAKSIELSNIHILSPQIRIISPALFVNVQPLQLHTSN
jgi:hypothetical protein